MGEEFTEYQNLFFERFLPTREKEKIGRMFALCVGPKEFGFEPEMLEYLQTHPHATLKELEDFSAPFFPEIVIEDD